MVAITRALRIKKASAEFDQPADESLKIKRALSDIDNSINDSTKVKRTAFKMNQNPPKSPRVERTPVKSLDTEQSAGVKYSDIPEDINLPAEFTAAHTPDFVRGAEFIVGVDPSLYGTLALAPFPVFATSGNEPKLDGPILHQYWYALIRGVIGQQVSGAAANSIEARFRALFSLRVMAPATVSEIPFDELRLAGLSASKVKYIIHISEVFSDPKSVLCDVKFYENELSIITAELQKLKGVGPWLATMFSLFTLKKLDVFAADDLGVARGVSRYLKARPDILLQVKSEVDACEIRKPLLKRKAKFAKPDSKRDWVPVHDIYVEAVADRFKPYRSVFMLLMWRLAATDVNVLHRST